MNATDSDIAATIAPAREMTLTKWQMIHEPATTKPRRRTMSQASQAATVQYFFDRLGLAATRCYVTSSKLQHHYFIGHYLSAGQPWVDSKSHHNV